MYQFPIGIMMDSLRMNAKDSIKKAAELGVKGLQMYATSGEFAPENMSAEKRRELLDIVKSHGLVFSAICGDLGQGFGIVENNPMLIEKSKRILDLAKDLETNIVTTHIGVIPENDNHPRYKIMQNACAELSRYADSIQSHFAVETGPEPAQVLKKFLDSLGSRGVAVNLDPANFIMVTGDDPVQAVYTLKDYIVHTHAKDGIKLRDSNPEIIYGIIEDVIQEGSYFRELPLGEGDVPFVRYLKALDDIGYTGFLTVEREVGTKPVNDISLAIKFLNETINSCK